MEIITDQLLEAYKRILPADMNKAWEALEDAPISTKEFSFYRSVAAVYSSKIEGEDMELDSYIKHKRMGVAFQPDYTKKVDDLYEAYQFAQSNKLDAGNVAEAHKLITRNILAPSQQGVLGTQNMYVLTPYGKIEYVVCDPSKVAEEMGKFYSDLELLLERELSIEESLYYAAMLHLVFVKIHPWNDGNGRTARLIEKWFLAERLGEKAWYVPSEKYYYEQYAQYYGNIRMLGLEYTELDYGQALPFLRMLVEGLVKK